MNHDYHSARRQNAQLGRGSILISREFYDTTTNNYLLIEAHEIRNSEVGKDGDFLVAFGFPKAITAGKGAMETSPRRQVHSGIHA